MLFITLSSTGESKTNCMNKKIMKMCKIISKVKVTMHAMVKVIRYFTYLGNVAITEPTLTGALVPNVVLY